MSNMILISHIGLLLELWLFKIYKYNPASSKYRLEKEDVSACDDSVFLLYFILLWFTQFEVYKLQSCAYLTIFFYQNKLQTPYLCVSIRCISLFKSPIKTLATFNYHEFRSKLSILLIKRELQENFALQLRFNLARLW